MKNIKRKATNLIVLAAIAVLSATPFRSFAPPCANTVQNLNDSGPGSLRDALLNATNGEVITFCPGLSGNLNTSFEFYVSNSVTILGPGANVVTLKGNTVFRIFYINPGLNVTIAGLTIDNGGTFQDTPIDGAGIYNNHSSLTISNCNLSNNQVFGSGNGGAIYNNAGGGGTSTVMVVNCTLVNNSAGSLRSGGAIYNNGQQGHAEVTLINSTLSGNHATSGAAIENVGEPASGFVTIKNCTFNNNGIHNNLADAVVTIGSTILNASSLARSSGGFYLSLGYNLSSDDGGGFLTQPTDQINTDPQLGPLQNNSGPIFTHAPLCSSPAIDHGTNFTGLATDQRGAPRTYDVAGITNAAGGDGTDIGAVESPILAFTVLNTNDSGPGSLRSAISNANASAGIDLIEFDPGSYGTITLTNGELLISDCLILDGPGPTNVAVDGNAAGRVFYTGPGINATIAGLTITNGFVPGEFYPDAVGAGIFNDHSTLTVSNCTVTGNSAGDTGGGIYNDGSSSSSNATLLVVATTLSGNSASGGGGIYNDGSVGNANLTVVNVTLSSNSVDFFGGGIFSDGGGGGNATLTLVNSTLSGNSAGSLGGGIYGYGVSGSATVNIGSTILNLNSIFTDSGTITSLGYNLSSDDGSGFLNQSTDQTNTNPLLGPLQLNGGQTPTHALLCGSPAIDAGTNLLALAIDQTGASRTFNDPNVPNVGDGTDIGAFEVQQICNQPPVALCTNVTVSADSNCVATASIDNGSYDPDAGDSITSRVQSPAGPYDLGTNLVTLTVTDSHGATNSCQGIVIVVDTTPPTIDCPTNIVTTNDPGQCSAVVSFSATATDNCAMGSISSDPASGSTFSTGTNTVTVTAVDAAGNTNTCSFTVTVLDQEPPQVACFPAPNPSGKISVPGKNGNTVDPSGYYQVLAKDNCDPAPKIYIKDTGSTFVAGPFKDGDIVRLKHTGGSPSSVPGAAPVVAVINLKGKGLNVAKDASGNVTPDSAGCLMQVSSK